ncbi:Imidazole glycerol phosphate synthase subunit HisF [bacterium HR11]|nr:Imidazole glycerol phosphate synthase subunit HisF [bacterium HR11]
MLARRLIPCLDVDRGVVVKGVRFNALQRAGDPVELARRYETEGADEVVFLDITATTEGRATLVRVVERTAEVLRIPFTVGGGIRSVADADVLFRAGADKVSVNTAAVENPRLIADLADRYGCQAVVVAIDVNLEPGGGYRVYTHAGKKPTTWEARAWAQTAARMGAGELLVTAIHRDGTGLGYDLDLLKQIVESVEIPVIASGGAGRPDHLRDALLVGADAVLLASRLHRSQFRIWELKKYLKQCGIPIR